MDTKVHPKEKANFVSKITLWWIFNLLWRGNLNPLNQEDLDSVREKDCAQFQLKRLEENWRIENISAHQQKRKPKLWKAMLRYFTWEDYGFLSFTCFLGVSSAVLYRYAVVTLLNALGSNFEHGVQSRSKYLVYVWGLILGIVMENVATRHFNLITPTLGIRSRAAIVGLIYQKVLKCSKTRINAGEVMELVCNDTQCLVTMADKCVPFLIRITIRCGIYIGWLLLLFGWRIVPGLAVFAFFSLFRILMTEMDVNLRRNISQIAEKRLGYLREVLTTIHFVKQNCLEHIYEEKIKNTRWQEIKNKAKRWIILSVSFSFTTCGQHLSTFATLMLLLFTHPSMLTVQNIFTIMLLFVSISDEIYMQIPVGIHFSTSILTALSRIQRFLERYNAMDVTIKKELPTKLINGGHAQFDETLIDPEVVSRTPYVWLDNVSCKLHEFEAVSSHQTKGTSLLNDISIKISSKGLIIITGSVGSGKSSVLASILPGELQVIRGTIKHSGNIAYVSDTPWVFPGTVRENILFGLAYDKKWYLKTIKACQLEGDLKRFPKQDLSRIGEHGATLSGGQRTRIALARAIYSRADIYLLDDPFSSLDAKVAENIFYDVLKGILSERIVFLTAHTYLSEADYIIELNKGMVVAQGTSEVMEKITKFKIVDKKDSLVQKTDEESKHVGKDNDLSEAEQLREAEEDRKVGSVSFKVDAKFFMFGAPVFVLLLILLIIGAAQGLTIWIDIQVSSLPNLKKQAEKFHKALIEYPISLIGAVLFTIFAKFCTILLPVRASYKVHNKMVSCLLQAPTHYYAVNPAGRILNRFSQDINNLDDLLPYYLVYFFQTVTLSLAALFLCLMTNVFLTPVILVTIFICFGVSRFFFKSAMDIKRLMSEAGGPFYSHFSNTMEGLRTIRVHKRQKKFTEVMMSYVDRHHEAMFAYYTAARWYGLTIDIVLAGFLAIVTTIDVYSIEDSSTAVITALAILYSSNAVSYVAAMVRNAVEVQAQMTSAERILAYTEIKPEKGCKIKKQPSYEWPQNGAIHFNNVSLRYYKNGPKVLSGISFQINASEKIGIVGRTGAGKSSLVAALMRIGEIEGNIFVDGVNIEDFNLQSTRRRISVISQSPVLFSGSIRENLSPTGDLNDSEIWKVLDQMQLGNLVRRLPNKLDNVCTGGGLNFSIGERQLFHLARVLLKQNKVVVFDEASGKVDMKTAEQIQKVIHGAFQDCTVITISHRMTTIQDCDRVMVLDQGSIVEFDRPDVLLNKENGLFVELTKIANEQT